MDLHIRWFFRKTSRKWIVANQSKWKYVAVRRSAKSMRHEISVDTDLGIRDGQLFENNFSFHFFLKIRFLLNTRWNNFISESFHLRTQGKIKFQIETNAGGILERFVEGTFGRTWLARFHHVWSKTHGVAVSEYFQIRSFLMILELNFLM